MIRILINTLRKLNYNKFLIIYILLQPLIDVLTSLCVRYTNLNLTLGIFIRSSFLLFTIIYSLSISNKKWRRLLLIYYLIVALYIIVFITNSIIESKFNLIIFQIKSLIKLFYFPILLVAFIPLINSVKIKNKYLIYTLFGYTSIISITIFLGIAFDSYADGSGNGKNGLFYAANEIGTIICVLIPFLFLNLINTKRIKKNKKILIEKIVEFFTFIFTSFSALWIGTKVPFLGLILSLSIIFMICIINIIKKNNIKNYIYKSLIIFIATLSVFAILPYSPVGKNLGVSFYKINKINTNKNTDFLDQPVAKEHFESVVLSNRNLYYKNTLKDYSASSTLSKLVGIGYIANVDNHFVQRKSIEIDYFDILFSNGVIGFFIFFAPLIAILIYLSKLLFKNKNVFFSSNTILNIYLILISLIIARLSGHIFTAPSVNFYLILAISKLITFLKNGDMNNDTI